MKTVENYDNFFKLGMKEGNTKIDKDLSNGLRDFFSPLYHKIDKGCIYYFDYYNRCDRYGDGTITDGFEICFHEDYIVLRRIVQLSSTRIRVAREESPNYMYTLKDFQEYIKKLIFAKFEYPGNNYQNFSLQIDTKIELYQKLFGEKKWESLIAEFYEKSKHREYLHMIYLHYCKGLEYIFNGHKITFKDEDYIENRTRHTMLYIDDIYIKDLPYDLSEMCFGYYYIDKWENGIKYYFLDLFKLANEMLLGNIPIINEEEYLKILEKRELDKKMNYSKNQLIDMMKNKDVKFEVLDISKQTRAYFMGNQATPIQNLDELCLLDECKIEDVKELVLMISCVNNWEDLNLESYLPKSDDELSATGTYKHIHYFIKDYDSSYPSLTINRLIDEFGESLFIYLNLKRIG